MVTGEEISAIKKNPSTCCQERNHVGCNQQDHGGECSGPLDLTPNHHSAWMMGIELQDLMFALLGFSCDLAQ